jgi:hypothetical protein
MLFQRGHTENSRPAVFRIRSTTPDSLLVKIAVGRANYSGLKEEKAEFNYRWFPLVGAEMVSGLLPYAARVGRRH